MEWIPPIVMFSLLIIGVPVAFSIGAGALMFFIFVPGVSPEAFVQRMVSMTTSFPLLAIPLFIFTGVAINHSGMGRRIINFADNLVGHMVGGLAQVNILLSVFMAGMTGSSVAEAAMESRVLIPEMVKKGYDKAFSVAVTVCSALIATMIPPSIGLILYGVLADVSIGKLFVGGIFPGIMMGMALMLVVKIRAKQRGYVPSHIQRASLREIGATFKEAFWALLIPFGIVAGLRLGAFTPTEAGAAAAIYATLVGVFIYHELNLQKLGKVILETVLLTSVIMMIICAANSLGFYLAWEQIPIKAAKLTTNLTNNHYVFLLIFNVFILMAGMFMDGAMLLVLLTPLFIPVIKAYGIDPMHFGILFTLNLEIGAVTPPIGIVMFTSMSIVGVSVDRYAQEAWPFLISLISVLLLVTYIPEISMLLPGLLFD